MNNVLRRFSHVLLSLVLVIGLMPTGAVAFGAETNASQSQTMSEALEFVYVDAASVASGDEQNIAIGFVDASLAADSTLELLTPSGKALSVKAANVADGAALFTISADKLSEEGSYTVKSVTSGNISIAIEGDDGAAYTFEVAVADASAQCDEQAELSFYTLSSDGELNEQTDLQSALDASASAQDGVAAAQSSSGTFVVALDPGHGGSDSGACGNGMQEKNLTLKIAQYCKAELETYSGVSVYMTRTTDEYVGLEERITRAVNHNADVFVSIHINSASGATGFEVWVQNDSSWRYALHTETTDLGNAILNKLSALGLTNRGVKERDYSTADGADENLYYNNGSGGYADYYSVLRNGRYNNLPSIIVEHLFINGSSADVAALKSESKLKQMGVLDAQGIAEYYELDGIPDEYDASASYAKTIEGGEYYITSALSNTLVLDVDSASTSAGANVQIYSSNKTNAQKFKITRNATTGYYTIKNVNSGLFLGLQMIGDTYKSNVVQIAKSSSNHSTNWIIEKSGDAYVIKNAANPSYVLDVDGASTSDGANVQVYTSNGTNAQKFTFASTSSSEDDPQGTQALEDGLYTLTCKASGKVIDVAGASTSDNANIQQYSANSTAAQSFYIEYDGAGYYTIRNLKSNKYLTRAKSSASNGTNVVQKSGGSLDTQKWIFEKNADGTFTILDTSGDYALDIAGASTDSGANAQVYSENGSNAQRFTATSVKGEQSIADGTYCLITKLSTQKAVDISGASNKNGANAQIYTLNKTDAQKFSFAYDADSGFYTITNVGSGKVLDVDGANAANGANVQQYASNSTLAQSWLVTKTSSGYKIASALDTSLVLDVAAASTKNGTNLQLYSSNNTKAQRFALEEPSSEATTTLDNGVYTLSCKASGKVLDVDSGSVSEGANIQQYSSNGTAAQQFYVSADESGYYTLRNIKSGMYLTRASATAKNGTNVVQKSGGSLDTQKWMLQPNSDGTFTFLDVDGNYALDIDGASSSNGANVQVYSSNGSNAQKFTPSSSSAASSIDEGTYYIISNIGSQKAIDIDSASHENGANAQIYTINQSDAQKFTFSFDTTTGYYTIKNVESGKVLDIDGAVAANGSNVQQYASNNTLAQKWVVVSTDNGYKIASALDTSFVLDVEGAVSDNGTNIQIYTSNDSNAQRFNITTETGTLIMGSADTTVAKMVQMYKNRVGASAYPSSVYTQYGASNITQFCQILYNEATAEGVKPGILFCQAMLETGWLQFGGDVSAEQCNFGGIGATGGGVAGVDFRTIATQKGRSTSEAVSVGLRAQAQHLKAYASTEAVNGTCYDPRFTYVKRGCAPTVEGLTGTWAASTTYANNLLRLYTTLQSL